MKKRNGFVSNSSSSSFVVVFPRKPRSVNEVKRLMFGVEETHAGYPTMEIAKSIYNFIKSQNNDREIKFTKRILDCIECGGEPDLIMEKFFPHLNEDDDVDESGYETDYWKVKDKIEAMQNGDCESKLMLRKKYPKGKLYNFGFSDDEGSYWSMMEHSDIFHNLPYELTSHHYGVIMKKEMVL